MGLWSAVKNVARKVYTTVKQAVAPAPAPAPAPTGRVSLPTPAPAPALGPRRAVQPAPSLTQQLTETVVSTASQPSARLPTSTSRGGGGSVSQPPPTVTEQPPPSLEQPLAPAPAPAFTPDPAQPQPTVLPPLSVRSGDPGRTVQDPFLSVAGQQARLESAVLTPIQALGAQFGIGPGVESDSAVLKWLANNPLVTAGLGAAVWTAGSVAIGKLTTTTLGGAAYTLEGGGVQLATNTASAELVSKSLSTVFSKKALLFFGAWAAAVGFGLWGRAEAPESPVITISQHMVADAERTEDWTLVDESMDAAREISDISNWDKLIAASPFAVIGGSANKLKGNLAGLEILQDVIDDKKQQQIDGTSEADYWRQRDQDQIAKEKAITDYYNQEAQKAFLFRQESENIDMRRDAEFWKNARAEERAIHNKQLKQDADFWAQQEAKQRQLEAEDRIAVAEFWLEYRKMVQKIADEDRPSNLNFGLI